MKKNNCKTLYAKHYKLNNKFGFSLIELMTVIAIVGIMTSIVVPYYTRNRDSKALSFGIEQIISDIRLVQNYAFSTLEADGSYPVGGYGINFLIDSNEYIIFADQDGNMEYNSGDDIVNTIKLSRGVKVVSLKINGTEDSNGEIDLVFTPPYGKVFIDTQNQISSNFINLEITVSNIIGSKTVTMSSSGLLN
ncbi:MAG: prepilin-type N-terminal cleavage/methylation domain-containing protein [Candidatus Pacebacteria bacterium]|nr:prepilin-type N-terminal cleavage/methylation domain-containing protein [Candidatus Paceibacterota bacterium]